MSLEFADTPRAPNWLGHPRLGCTCEASQKLHRTCLGPAALLRLLLRSRALLGLDGRLLLVVRHQIFSISPRTLVQVVSSLQEAQNDLVLFLHAAALVAAQRVWQMGVFPPSQC